MDGVLVDAHGDLGPVGRGLGPVQVVPRVRAADKSALYLLYMHIFIPYKHNLAFLPDYAFWCWILCLGCSFKGLRFRVWSLGFGTLQWDHS